MSNILSAPIYDEVLRILDSGKPIYYKDEKRDLVFYKRADKYMVQSLDRIEAMLPKEQFRLGLEMLDSSKFNKTDKTCNIIEIDFINKRRVA